MQQLCWRRSVLVLAAAVLAAEENDPERFPRRIAGKPLENVTYLHIPKTGSTFENIVFRSACRWQTPPFIEAQTVVHFVTTHCPKSFEHFQSGHRPLPFPVKRRGQVFVTLLRKPWRRVHSGLLHNFHDCPRMQESQGVRENDMSRSALAVEEAKVLEYASCVEACAVNMLSGFNCGARLEDDRREEVVKSSWKMLQSFDFVGISDYWDLTLRLFSQKFDVEVVRTDRLHLRSRNYDHDDDWVPDLLKNRRMIDDTLYDLALLEIFFPELEKLEGERLDRLADDSISRSQDWNLGNIIAPVLHGPGFITQFNGTHAFASYGPSSAAASWNRHRAPPSPQQPPQPPQQQHNNNKKKPPSSRHHFHHPPDSQHKVHPPLFHS